MKRTLLISCIMTVLILSGCVVKEGKPLSSENRFAFALYDSLKIDKSSNSGNNIFFSPQSILVAMGIVYEGARGKTAQELAQVLHIPAQQQRRRSDYVSSRELYTAQNKSYALTMANGVWIQDQFNILSSYRDAIAGYNATIQNVDFVFNADKALETINMWVNDQTRGMIKQILSRNAVNERTRLVITNAIYFKGTWQHPFDPDATVPGSFFINPRESVSVPMMHDMQSCRYAENQKVKLLELSYKGGDLVALFVLPKDKNFTDDWFNGYVFEEIQDRLVSQKVYISIPRIALNTTYSLVNNFKQMGIVEAFEPPYQNKGADFSGIDDQRDLYISLIAHKAALILDEKGTEASAATAAVIGFTSIQQDKIPEFIADHPFIFIIQEKKTNNVLFMGYIANPAK